MPKRRGLLQRLRILFWAEPRVHASTCCTRVQGESFLECFFAAVYICPRYSIFTGEQLTHLSQLYTTNPAAWTVRAVKLPQEKHCGRRRASALGRQRAAGARRSREHGSRPKDTHPLKPSHVLSRSTTICVLVQRMRVPRRELNARRGRVRTLRAAPFL